MVCLNGRIEPNIEERLTRERENQMSDREKDRETEQKRNLTVERTAKE